MKKLFSMVLAIIFLFSFHPSLIQAQSKIYVSVDGQSIDFDVQPTIIQGRTLVPLRGIFETLDISVHWDGKTKTVTAVKQEKKIILKINETFATMNEKQLELDVPAKVINGRTMVPIRFIAESTGCEVNWNNNTKTVTIISSTKTPVGIDWGSIQNSVYKNNYLGLTIPVPNDWYVLDNEMKKLLLELGKETLSEASDSKITFDSSELASLNLLTMFQYPLETPVESNPSFVCVAEKISQYPNLQTNNYLLLTKDLLQSTQMELIFEKDIYSETIDTTSFDVMELKIPADSMTLTQKYYCVFIKDYALTFIITYESEEESKILDNILDDIEISQK
jgi:hypothetical protein